MSKTRKELDNAYRDFMREVNEMVAATSARPAPERRGLVARWLRGLVGWWRDKRRMREIQKACRDSRRRMNGYTQAQRDELYRRGMEIVNSGRKTPPPNNSAEPHRATPDVGSG